MDVVLFLAALALTLLAGARLGWAFAYENMRQHQLLRDWNVDCEAERTEEW